MRVKFVEGGWELTHQTQDESVVAAWDDDIDAREERTGLDCEWILMIPYGLRPVP